MAANITAAQALSYGADSVVFSERPLPQAPTGYYDWEVSSDPAAGRKGHSLVSNLIGEVEVFKAKGHIQPDPKIVVSTRLIQTTTNLAKLHSIRAHWLTLLNILLLLMTGRALYVQFTDLVEISD